MDRETPRAEIAHFFGVSLATTRRWLKHRRETGEVATPRPSPGRTPSICKNAEERSVLWRQLKENREATLERHCELWERECGVRVSVATMSWAIRKVG